MSSLVETVRAFRRPGAVLLAAAFGAIFVLVVTGCGSSAASTAQPPATTSATPATTTGTTTTGTPTTSGGFAAYQACLQQHGVTLPQGGGFGRGFGRRGGGAGGAAEGGGNDSTAGTTTTGTIGGAPAGGTGSAGAGGAGAGPRPALTAAQQKALADCASLRPTSGLGRGGGFGGGGFNSNNPAYAKFEACLKDHGVQTGSPGGAASTAARAAFTACRSLLPAGGRFGGGAGAAGGGSGTGTTSSTFAAFQACLKQHGVQTGAAGQTPAKTQAAIAACRSLLPNGGNAATTTGTTTTG